MRPTPRRAVALLAMGLLAFALVLAAAGLVTGWREVAAELTRLDAALILGLLALSLANYLLRGLRWWLLARANGTALAPGRALLDYTAGFALTATPGKLGEVVRLWLMRRHGGHPYERTMGLLVLDRLSDALPMLLLVAAGAGAIGGHGASVALVGLLVLLPGLLVLRPGPLERATLALHRLTGRAGRLLVRARRASCALGELATPGLLAAACTLGLLGWAAEIAGLAWLMDALGWPIGLPAAAFVFGFAMLVGALPLFPGGVGGTEATMIALLVALATPPEVAVAATGVCRLATLGFATLLGLLALPPAIGRRATAAEPVRVPPTPAASSGCG